MKLTVRAIDMGKKPIMITCVFLLMGNHESGGKGQQGVQRTLVKAFGSIITIGLALFLGMIIAANLFGLRYVFMSDTMHGTQLIGTVLVSIILIIAAIYGLIKL